MCAHMNTHEGYLVVNQLAVRCKGTTTTGASSKKDKLCEVSWILPRP